MFYSSFLLFLLSDVTASCVSVFDYSCSIGLASHKMQYI